MIPSCDHTGTPLHFHSSTTSGSACLMRARTRESVLPLQSSSSLILASISREGDSPLVVALFFILFCTSFGCFSILRRYQSPIVRAGVLRPALSYLATFISLKI